MKLYFNFHGGSYKTYETILWLACIQLAMFCLLLWVLMPCYLSAGEAWTSLQKICMFLFKLHFSSVFFLVNSKKMISGLEVGLIQKRGVSRSGVVGVGWGCWAPGQERYDLSILNDTFIVDNLASILDTLGWCTEFFHIYTLPTKLTVTSNVACPPNNQSCRKRKPWTHNSKYHQNPIEVWSTCGLGVVPQDASCSSWSFFFPRGL